jgi:hypothetical protein
MTKLLSNIVRVSLEILVISSKLWALCSTTIRIPDSRESFVSLGHKNSRNKSFDTARMSFSPYCKFNNNFLICCFDNLITLRQIEKTYTNALHFPELEDYIEQHSEKNLHY